MGSKDVLVLREEDVARLLPMSKAILAIETAARDFAIAEAESMPRRRLRTADRQLHVLAAASDRFGQLGVKTYLSGGAKTQFWYQLFDRTGLRALIEADLLGRIRTGAATAVATDILARASSTVLCIIGTGNQAFTQIEGVANVRRLREVRIVGRDPERREALAQRVREHFSLLVTTSGDAQRAVAGAHIVITVTSSREPVLLGEWLSRGTHVNAVGSNKATHREVDDGVLERCHTILVEDKAQAREEAGDLLRAEQLDWNRVQLLPAAVHDIHFSMTPPLHEGDCTFFESLGIGLWDLAVAHEVFRAYLAEVLLLPG